MTRLHHPVTIPGLLPVPPVPGTLLVLDADGEVNKAGGGGGPGDPPNPPHRPITVDDILTKEPWPTGPTSGGLITITDTYEVTIAAGEGVIVNSYDDPYNIIVDKVSWVEQSIDFGPITTRAYSYVYIDPAGVFQFFTARPDPALIRKNIWMARVVHDISDGSVISIRPAHMIPAGTSQMFADFMLALGIPILINGADVTGNADLTFATDASQWFGPGESWQQDKDDPNIANNPGADPQPFYYMKSNGILEPVGITVDVDPDLWENPLGTLDSVSPGPNTSTIQRLWTSISGVFIMTYGQIEYPTLEDARNAISEDNALFVKPQYLSDERATLVAYFVMEHSATDLLNGIDVIIISPEGTPVSGGASGPHTHDAVYLRLDAQNDPMQQNLDMGVHLINNVVDPVQPQDAATKIYVDNQRDHLLYGNPQHTDVDDVVVLSDRHILAVPAGVGDWTPELRMNWRNKWLQGTYYIHDTVRDGDWLMTANKETTDRPSPVPIGTASFLLPDAPTWVTQQYTGSVFSGMHIDVPQGELFQLQSVRVWVGNISPDAHYQVVVYNTVTGLFDFTSSFDGDVLQSPGWVTRTFTPLFITDLDDFYIMVHNSNSAADTTFNHPWVRQNNSNQDNDPGAGNWNRDNNNTRLRISATDDDALPRNGELGNVVPGTILRPSDEANLSANQSYEVLTVTDNGTWFQYDVVLLDTGAGGDPTVGLRQQIYFEIPIATPTDYVNIVGYFAGNADIDGYLAFDSPVGGTDNDDAWGIDIQLQAYSASDDWDVMAITGGGGASGGGEGTNPLPIGGATDQALVKASAADYDVTWAGPHLQLTGGVLTGFLTLHADPTDPLHAATKQYADSAGFSGDHDDLTNVLTDQHHVRYSDAEARSAVVGIYLPLAGGTMTNFITLHADPSLDLHAATKQYVDGTAFSGEHNDLANVLTDQHHVRYDDAEAVGAMGVEGDANPLNHERYTDAEAVTAVGPHTTLLGQLTDVDVSGVSDNQVLGYNSVGAIWEPKENRGDKGIISLEYLWDAGQASPPASGDVSANAATPAATTILNVSDTDSLGDAVGFILGNITAGDLIVLYDKADDTNRQDYTVVSSVDNGTWHAVTVTPTFDSGTIPDNAPIFMLMFQTVPDISDIYLRLDATNDPLTGDLLLAGAPTLDLHAATKKYVDDATSGITTDHDDLTNVTTSQHHVRYSDAEAIAAVGPVPPPQTFLHEDLTDVVADQHHTRYTDGEAVLATTDHFTQTTAPASPSIGTVWVNPDEPPEATYLPLTGGTLTGDLDLSGNDLTGVGTLNPGVVIKAAAASGVIQRWNGDGDAGSRHFEWRRSASFGALEFYGITSADVASKLVEYTVDSGGSIKITAGAFDVSGPFVNIERSGSGMLVGTRTGQTTDGTKVSFQLSGGFLVQVGSANGAVPTTTVLNMASTRFWVSTGVTDVRFQQASSFATTSTANLAIPDLGNGLIRIATSSRRYKTNIKDAPQLKDIVLSPVSFYREDDDRDLVGLIAEDLADEDERLALYDADGLVNNFADRGVLAVLAAKVNDQEARINELENA